MAANSLEIKCIVCPKIEILPTIVALLAFFWWQFLVFHRGKQIPATAKTMEAQSGHVLRCKEQVKKKKKKKMSPYSLCDDIQVEDSAFQFVEVNIKIIAKIHTWIFNIMPGDNIVYCCILSIQFKPFFNHNLQVCATSIHYQIKSYFKLFSVKIEQKIVIQRMFFDFLQVYFHQFLFFF